MQIIPCHYSAAIHGTVIRSMQPQGDLRCNIMTHHSHMATLGLLHIQVSAGDEPRMAGAEMSRMTGAVMSCMAGAEVSRMAGDGDVLYGRR